MGYYIDAPRSGERAPDADLIAADECSTTLFAHLYNPDGWSWGWSLLVFDGQQPDAMPQLRLAIEAVRGWEWGRPSLVLADAVPALDDATVLSDLDGDAHVAYGIGSNLALILVRRNGDIALRGVPTSRTSFGHSAPRCLGLLRHSQQEPAKLFPHLMKYRKPKRSQTGRFWRKADSSEKGAAGFVARLRSGLQITTKRIRFLHSQWSLN